MVWLLLQGSGQRLVESDVPDRTEPRLSSCWWSDAHIRIASGGTFANVSLASVPNQNAASSKDDAGIAPATRVMTAGLHHGWSAGTTPWRKTPAIAHAIFPRAAENSQARSCTTRRRPEA